MSYIGQKIVKRIQDGEVNGIKTIEVSYEDGMSETLSKRMYDVIVSDVSCDATALREKRVLPIVAEILGVLRSWGIKLNELQYMSVLLNTSLQENEKEALAELWKRYIPTLTDTEEVNLIAIDQILKEKKEKPIPTPYADKKQDT